MIATFEFVRPKKLRKSPTMSAAAMAKDAKEKYGKDVIALTIGDLRPKPTRAEKDQWLKQMEATTAEYATKPVAQQDPKFRQMRVEEEPGAASDTPVVDGYSETNGLPTLRATMAECFSKDTGMDADISHVGIGNGGKGALNGALYMFDPGETVFVAAPGWPTNYDMFFPGVRIIEIPTKDGIMRAEDLRAAVAQHGEPRAVLINAPNNPTGANYTPEEREAFFGAVRDVTKKTMILNDDPYGKLVFDRPVETALRRGKNEKAVFNEEREAVFRTVSKEYGLAGNRVGFLITKNKEMLESLQLWNESISGGMAVKPQLMAQAALLYGEEFIHKTVEILRKKRDILVEGIAKLDGATVGTPSGTIYGWVDFAKLKGAIVPAGLSETKEAYTIDSPAAMMRYLVNVAGVCGVPGVPFYAPGSPAGQDDWHVRITFCGDEKKLSQALANLKTAEQGLEGLNKNNTPEKFVNGGSLNGKTEVPGAEIKFG